MGTRTVLFCDRSNKVIPITTTAASRTPDLVIQAPWLESWNSHIQDLIEEAGAGNFAEGGGFGFQDLCDDDRKVVANLIARICKVDVRSLDARGVEGDCLFEPLDEPEPEPLKVVEDDDGA